MQNKNLDSMIKLIEKINIFNSEGEALDFIFKKVAESAVQPVIVSFINAHAFNLSRDDAEFYNSLLVSDVLLRDGKGIKILKKAIKSSAGYNLNGTDFIPFILMNSIGKRVALLGTTIPYIKNASLKLQQQGHDIVLIDSGFLSFEEYHQLIEDAEPELIILGMGMPKQEKLSLFLKNSLKYPCLIINGGAIIDFLGNRFKRAPIIIQKLEMEWFYRFILEPNRLFKRYIIGNLKFLFNIYLLKSRYK